MTETMKKVLMATTTWMVLCGAIASAAVTDQGVYAPSNYSSQPPAKGGAYVDAAFGTTIKRLSNALTTPDDANGGMLQYILNEYSTPSLWNTPNTYLLLNHGSYFAVYDGNGVFIKNAPFDMHAATEPRWSRQDPNLVYYKRGNALKSYNVATGAISVVRAFPEYGAISGRGKSDMCYDGDHVVLVGDMREVFVYTLSTNQKSAVFNVAGNGFESINISADDRVVIGWNAVGAGRYRGVELFDMNMSFQRQLTQATAHMDMARDTNGDALLVYMTAADPAAVCENGIVKVRLSDARHTCLVTLDWSLAVHVSAGDQPVAVVSTYAPGDPSPTGFWPPFTQEVFLVKLDGSGVERLAHHRSRPFNSYNWMPKGSISRDGTKITFSSNFGQVGGEYGDVYLLNRGGSSPVPTATATPAPRTTPSPTAGPTATPAPTGTPQAATKIEQDNGSVQYAAAWTTQTKSVHSANTAAYTAVPGAEITVPFNGTAITWRGSRDPWAGKAEVYVDGALKATVDTYSADEKNQEVLYTAGGLANGAHTFKVRVLGTMNPAAGGALVWADSFEITGGGAATPTSTPAPTAAPTVTPRPTQAPPTATPAPTAVPGVPTKIEQNHGSVTYTGGTWTTQTKSVHSGNSSTYTQDAGAEASLAFTGTGIVWRGSRDPWAGQAQVYVDGVLKATVDTYSAVEKNQDVLYAASGLSSGAHTFKVRVLGTKNPAAGAALVWVDSFEIAPDGAPTASPTPAPTATPVPTATPSPTGTPGTPVKIEQNHSSATYSGSWYTQSKVVHSGGSATFTMNAGAEVSVAFTGTSIVWRGSRDPWAGQAQVYVDGALTATVDAYSSVEKNQDVLYTASGLSNGAHTFKVRVLGTKNPASGGALVWVDSFTITSGGGAATPAPTPTSAPAVRLEESNPAVRYTGTWFPNSAGVHSGGSARGAMDAGSQAVVTFTGTGLRWIGYRDEWSGNARVLVDGVLKATVDTYSAPQKAQQVLHSVTGLTPGAHTLTVDVPGTAGPSSGGAWVWVDAFEVVP
jgi:hypothetical protein